MHFETRRTGGKPSLVLIPNEEEAKILDQVLGDCGSAPIALQGYIKLPDDCGPVYISLWNPQLNPDAKVPVY